MLPELSLDARALVQPLGSENQWSELGDGTVEFWGHVIRVVAYDAVIRSDDSNGSTQKPNSRNDLDDNDASEAGGANGSTTMSCRQDTSCGEDFDNVSGGSTDASNVSHAQDEGKENHQQQRHVVVLEDLIDDGTPFVGENSCIVWNSVAQQLSFCLMFVTDAGFCAAWSALQALQQKPYEPLRVDFLRSCRIGMPSSSAPSSAFDVAGSAVAEQGVAVPAAVGETIADESAHKSRVAGDPAACGNAKLGGGGVTYADIICQGNAVPHEDAEDPVAAAVGSRRGLGFIERHVIALSIIEFDHGSNPALFQDLHTCVTLLKFCHPDLTEYFASSAVYPLLVKGLESASEPPELWTPPSALEHLVGNGQKDLTKILNTSLRLHHLRHEVLPVGIDEDVTAVIDSVNHRLQNEAICAILSDEVCLKAAVQALYALPTSTVRGGGKVASAGTSSSSSPIPSESATSEQQQTAVDSGIPILSDASGDSQRFQQNVPSALSVPPSLSLAAVSVSSSGHQQVEAFISNHLRFFSSLITLSISAFAKDLVPAVIAKICQSGLLEALSVVLERFVLTPPHTPASSSRKAPSSRQSSAQSLSGRPTSSSAVPVLDQPAAPALDLPQPADVLAGSGNRSQSQQSFVEDQGSAPIGPMNGGLGCKSPSPTEAHSSEGLSTCSGATVSSQQEQSIGVPSVSEPRPPTGSRAAPGARHHSGRAKKSAPSPSPHSAFITYSQLIDDDITNLLEATIVRLNEKQDEMSLHEIFRVPILEHPEKHHALLSYLVKQICVVPHPTSSQNGSNQQQQHDVASSSSKMATTGVDITGVGRNKFILFHLLGMHDDEGSSSTERILDAVNHAKRDQFHSLIITSYLVPACRGASGFSRSKRPLSEAPAPNATTTHPPINGAAAVDQLMSLGISPAFVRVLEYMLTLTSQMNQLALLDGILHPKAAVLKYVELCARLSTSAAPIKVVRSDVLCGNVRLVKAIFTITASDKGKYWQSQEQQHQQQHPCNGKVESSAADDQPQLDNHAFSSIPATVPESESGDANEMRQQFASRIARTLCVSVSSGVNTTQPPAGDLLGALFQLYKSSGGVRKNSLFHSTVNAVLRLILDTEVLGSLRAVVLARYRPLLPPFFVSRCDGDLLQAALKAILAKSETSSGLSNLPRSGSSVNSVKSSGGIDEQAASAGGGQSPVENGVLPAQMPGAVRSTSSNSASAGRVYAGVDEMPPPPDAKQMEDMARFSPKLRSSLERMSPAPMMASLDEPVSRNESISPLPQILPHRPGSGGALHGAHAVSSAAISHIPKSPQHSSLENYHAEGVGTESAAGDASSPSPQPKEMLPAGATTDIQGLTPPTQSPLSNETPQMPLEPIIALNSDSSCGDLASSSAKAHAVGKPSTSPVQSSSARRGSTGATAVLTPTMPKQGKQPTTVARKQSAGASAGSRPAGSPTAGTGRGNAKPKASTTSSKP